MNVKLLIKWMFVCVFGITTAQQITLDTSLVSSEANTIEEFWYWSGGFPVVGSGFTPNSTVTVYDTDPNGGKWRDFIGTADSQGNFSIQISAKMLRSVKGAHTVKATDAQGKTSNATLQVIANKKEIVSTSVSSSILKQSQFATNGFKVKATGLTPGVRLTVHMFTPYEQGSEVTPLDEKYADANGEFEMDINQYTLSHPWGDMMPDTPGTWRISVQEFTSDGYYGSANFRLLADNQSSSNYCTVEQQATFVPVTPITSFEIVGVGSNTSSVESDVYYEDFTSKIFDLTAGQKYSVKIKGKNNVSYAPDTYTLFMDWNQNGILDDDNEIVSEGYIYESTGTDDKFTQFDFTVPQNVINGNTRLRVLKIQSATTYSMFWPTGACGYNFASGQVEDYSLKISGGITDPGCDFDCPTDMNVNTLPGQSTATVNYNLPFTCSTQPATTCNLTYPSNNFENGINNSNFNLVANDFDVPAGQTMKITQIIPNLVRNSFGASVTFYKDNNGKPGEQIATYPDLTYASQTQIGTGFSGYPVFEVVMNLPTALEVTSGKYWVAINAQGPLIFWESKSNGTTAPSHTSTNGTIWTASPTGLDGVFKVGYECADTSTPEVVLTEGLESGSEFPEGNTIVVHNLVYKGIVIDTCIFNVKVNKILATTDVIKDQISVYPNPVKDFLKISNIQDIKKVNIYDMSGKLVFMKELNNKNADLDLSKLNSGIYILKVNSGKEVKAFKLIKK